MQLKQANNYKTSIINKSLILVGCDFPQWNKINKITVSLALIYHTRAFPIIIWYLRLILIFKVNELMLCKLQLSGYAKHHRFNGTISQDVSCFSLSI